MVKNEPLHDVMSALADSSHSRRSPLFKWLRDHHAEIAAMIAVQGVHWSSFTKVLADRGMTDRTGKPVLAHTVKTTWYRVCAEAAAKPESVRAKPHPGNPDDMSPIPNAAAGPVRLPPPPSLSPEGDDPSSGMLGQMLEPIGNSS